ncbi:MAG TPA: PQQ-dependent sugar dehydrogenase [Pyrinomonadaceae bacterium]|nr:PQQ-dependent sugar dehydrogenase [Pyrinomonadaceae bacterium]
MRKLRFDTARFVVLPSLLAAVFGLLLSSNNTIQLVHAFSAGPPAGYTGAPGEEPEACAECHVPSDAGTGKISITAPQTYVPGQTYPITVTHMNADPTRLRWGFELTVLDTSDEKAGELQNTGGLTQVLNNQGPGGARQYIEHTSVGTFVGQQNGASWTFNWTAPATDVGPVTFYTAGNQANNDGNTSGDYIYKTFVAAAPASTTPDFSVAVSPSSRNVVPGASAQYTITVTPLAGFTGAVNLTASSLPAGASAVFSPSTVNITDASSKTSTLTLSTTAGTPLGNHTINVNGQTGPTMHAAVLMLNVVSPASADLSVNKTASPNPGQVGVNLSYHIVVTNNGPAAATNVNSTDTLPAGLTFVSSSATQGGCSGTSTVSCGLGSLAVGASAVVTIVVTPSASGQIVNTATASGSESDFDSSNNSSSITTLIQPAASSPSMLDPNLTVSTVVAGLNQPTSMAFIGPNDFFVLERTTGKVQRIVSGAVSGTPLDLAVNGASERGLLGIALHPKFALNGFVYLFWTESSTGVDTSNIDEITQLGNRVDRYIWNGTTLVFDRNLIKLRALQQDAGQTARGNHNGGVIRFGADQKLYIIFGDNGRRGFLQNITNGQVPDDQFGGPEPDNAHLTGVILRLNDDGSTPIDNPFFNASTGLTGEAAANVKKVFAYGVRNSFGMAIDPLSGNLWTEENGDDAFDEINRVIPGFNGGWIQVIGPLNRIGEFKSIESTYGAGNLQQLRWPPANIASTPQEALARLYMLPGAQYVDPEFSWKYAVAPSPIGFINGRGLGPEFEGDLLVGASRTTLLNGFLLRFRFTADRQHFTFTDPRLADRVADNNDKFDQTESESLVIGQDFGVTTDIGTGPNGNVFVVSLSNGAVYEIKSKPSLLFVANLNGAQEVPPTISNASGTATLLLSPDEKTARVSLNFTGLSSPQTAAHIHGPAAPGVSGLVLFPLPNGQVSDWEISLLSGQAQDLKNGLWYVNVHSNNFPNGEIRGQFQSVSLANSVGLNATKYVVNEGEGKLEIMVRRQGDSSGAATVNYATSDTAGLTNCTVINGTASERCDYGTTVGTLRFAAGETSKTFLIPIVDDGFVEGNETFTVTLSAPIGATLGSPQTATVTINENDTVPASQNPIDGVQFFVTQQYIDFLGRLPDTIGFANWVATLNGCPNGGFGEFDNPNCDRVHVSAGFFLSEEFQGRGYWAYRFYEVGLDRRATYAEFVPDMAQVGGAQSPESEALSKAAYTDAFVQRAEFKARYDALSNAAYVNALEVNAEVTVENKAALIAALDGAQMTRGQVLRDIVESQAVANRFFNRAFVAMQYFGYLRRDPDTIGFQNWLTTLNADPSNFRHMIFGFIYSTEYRQRFGP